MYKVKLKVLEELKKQLIANNKHLATHSSTPAIAKLIKSNDKQIKLITNEFYIN